MNLKPLILMIGLEQNSPEVLLPAVNVLLHCLKNASQISFLAFVAPPEGRVSTRALYGVDSEHCCSK
jgi:hypothetical protein